MVATTIFALGVLALVAYDLRNPSRPSVAVAIPAIYLFIVASRPVTLWLNQGWAPTIRQAEDGSPLDAFCYAVLYALAASVLVRRRATIIRLLRPNWPLTTFYAYCFLSLAWSDYPMVGLKRYIKLIGDLMMVLVVLTDKRPTQAIRFFLSWSALGLVPLSVFVIKYHPDLGKAYDAWTGQAYFQGVSFSKNGLGAICLYWGVAYVWLLVKARGEKRSGRFGGLIALAMLGMVFWLMRLADSKTSLSCLLFGITLIVVLQFRTFATRPFLIHSMVAVMILVPSAVLFLGQMGGALELLGRDATLTDRTALWSEIFKLQSNPIIGSGFESFWQGERLLSLWNTFWWMPTQSHNGYIEVLVNLGWVGVALLSALLLSSYHRAVQAINYGDEASLLLLAFLVISIPYNFTEATFRIQTLPWLLILLASVGVMPGSSAAATVQEKRVSGKRYPKIHPAFSSGTWAIQRAVTPKHQ